MERTMPRPPCLSNVLPPLALSGESSFIPGTPYCLTLGAVDGPVQGYTIHWGDGNADYYSTQDIPTNHQLTHTYVSGSPDLTIMVDVTDEEGHTYVNAASMDVSSVVFQPCSGQAFTITAPTSGTYAAGRTVTIQWTAGNVVNGSKISLCYDTNTTFSPSGSPDGTEHWIEIDGVAAASGIGSYTWNTSGVAAGTYYIAGYMYDNAGTFTFSHLTQAITITPAQAFTITAPTSGTYAAGQTVTIQWTAGNVPAGGKISLCYDTNTTFSPSGSLDGTEHWIEIDGVAAANGNGSYTWNTSGVAAGTYYIAGYLWDGGNVFTFSHLTQAITIPPSTLHWRPQGASTTWSTSTTVLNWFDGTSQVCWQDGATAIFDGTGGGTATISGTVDPSVVCFDTSSYIVNGGAIGIASGCEIDVDGGLSATIESNIAGGGSLTKSGFGTLTLGGTDSYSGATSIEEGVLCVGSLGNTNGVTLGSAMEGPPPGSNLGTLSYAGASNYSYSGPITVVGLGEIDVAAATTLTLSGNIHDANSLTIGGAGNATISGTIDNGSGLNSGNGSIVETGSGTLTLSGTNTYTGSTTISGGGTLSTGNLGTTSGINLNGGMLDYTGTSPAFTGGFTIGADGGQIDVASGKTFTVSSVISGNGSLIVGGGGTLTLSGSNTFTGNTRVYAGSLLLSNALALQNSTLDLENGDTGTISVGSLSSVTLGGLMGSRNLLLPSGTSLKVGQNNSSTTYSGNLSGSNFTKIGAGTLALSGANTYTGTTTINQGTLSVSNVATGGNLGNNTTAVTLGDASDASHRARSPIAAIGYAGTFSLALTLVGGGGEIDAVTAGQTLALNGDIIVGSSMLTVSGAGNATIYGIVSGTGSVVKAGTGTLTLGKANNYGVPTTISAGKLAFGINATYSASMTVNGGTLDLNGENVTVGAVTLNNGSIINSGSSAA